MPEVKVQPTSEDKPNKGFKLVNVFKGPSHRIVDFAWSPDGNFIAAAVESEGVRIWFAQTGKTLHAIKDHRINVFSVTWAPNGRTLAGMADDGSVQLWDVKTGKLKHRFKEKRRNWTMLAWSPDGRNIAAASIDGSIRLWDANTGNPQYTFKAHAQRINSIAWSPDGWMLVSGSDDHTIRIWDIRSGKSYNLLKEHGDSVTWVAWSPDGRQLASGSKDNSVRLWDAAGGWLISVLKGHTDEIYETVFSMDNRLLASSSADGTIRLWRCDVYEEAAVFEKPETVFLEHSKQIAFHPAQLDLAVTGNDGKDIQLWNLDARMFTKPETFSSSVHYANAKVVFVGDEKSGKTTLLHALAEKDKITRKMKSGLEIANLEPETLKLSPEEFIRREIYVWDIPSDPETRVIQELFMDQAALCIVVFDPTRPLHTLGSVRYWEKAIKDVIGTDKPRLLVAAGVDRSPAVVSLEVIKKLCNAEGFRGYIATSAVTGRGIAKLRRAISKVIPWEDLSVTEIPTLWISFNNYLSEKKKNNSVLIEYPTFCDGFRKKFPDADISDADLNTLIEHAKSRGLIQRITFGDFVLLNPDILYRCALSIVREARRHPNGLGSVLERDVLEAKISFEERIFENIDFGVRLYILHAVVELLLERKIALRVGGYLVLPSLFEPTTPEYDHPHDYEVTYDFTGNPQIIFAILATILSNSGAFKLKDIWKNAATFLDPVDKTCGFRIEIYDKVNVRIGIFFDKWVVIATKVSFLQFIHDTIYEYAEENSVVRTRTYRCFSCDHTVQDRNAVEARLKRNKTTICCQYCDETISLIDRLEEKFGIKDNVYERLPLE